MVSFAGVNLYGGSRESSLLNIPQADSLSTEYSSMACTVEVVDDVHAAIEHINKNERSCFSFKMR